MEEYVEILSGVHCRRIGLLIDQCPLFVTVRLIVDGISTDTIDVMIPVGQWHVIG